MPAPQNASVPAFFTMANNYTIRLTALSPTTGNVVAGVVVSDASVAVDGDTAPGSGPTVPIFPAFLPGG